MRIDRGCLSSRDPGHRWLLEPLTGCGRCFADAGATGRRWALLDSLGARCVAATSKAKRQLQAGDFTFQLAPAIAVRGYVFGDHGANAPLGKSGLSDCG